MYKDKGSSSRGTDPMGAVVCAGRISEHLEGECVGRSGGKAIRI